MKKRGRARIVSCGCCRALSCPMYSSHTHTPSTCEHRQRCYSPNLTNILKYTPEVLSHRPYASADAERSMGARTVRPSRTRNVAQHHRRMHSALYLRVQTVLVIDTRYLYEVLWHGDVEIAPVMRIPRDRMRVFVFV